jgi:hypothetical protein
MSRLCACANIARELHTEWVNMVCATEKEITFEVNRAPLPHQCIIHGAPAQIDVTTTVDTPVQRVSKVINDCGIRSHTLPVL